MKEIKFLAFGTNGLVIVSIKGVKYRYITDAIYHANWKRRARYTPGKVLNEVKSAALEVS